MAISDLRRLLTGGVMTGTNVLLSNPLDLARCEKASLEIQVPTTSVTGTLTLEGTNQPNPSNEQQPDPNAVWVPLASGATVPVFPAVNLAAAALALMVGLAIIGGQAQCRWVRVRYVNATGSGVLNIFSHRSGPT
jgi:hypothetical protein